MTENQQLLQKILTDIAQKHFHSVETLETRNNDSLDFHDASVWAIKEALEDAFIAGMKCGGQISN